MLRVSVFEAEPEMNLKMGKQWRTRSIRLLYLPSGPGRSTEAKQKFAAKVTEILSENLGCKKEEVRIYILSSEGNHFAIGGRPKVFQKLPEEKKEEK